VTTVQERLREFARIIPKSEVRAFSTVTEAADRIDELEAALREIYDYCGSDATHWAGTDAEVCWEIANRALESSA
jgi:hypothetical protein